MYLKFSYLEIMYFFRFTSAKLTFHLPTINDNSFIQYLTGISTIYLFYNISFVQYRLLISCHVIDHVINCEKLSSKNSFRCVLTNHQFFSKYKNKSKHCFRAKFSDKVGTSLCYFLIHDKNYFHDTFYGKF